MRRREFLITVCGLATAWPLAAQAREKQKLGFLWDSPEAFADAIKAFQQRLRDLGYVDGKTITIEYRWASNSKST
jgi:putative ABC transport system substrate-binding protein